jgi:hypothetical protein
MKCIGFENPPCVGCAKVGRECIPQQYTRNRSGLRVTERTPAPRPAAYTINQVLTPRGPNTWSPSESGIGRPREEHLESRDWPSNDSNLPSIYSTPPLVSIVEQTTPSDSTYSVSSNRRRIEPPSSEDPLFHRDMVRLIGL